MFNCIEERNRDEMINKIYFDSSVQSKHFKEMTFKLSFEPCRDNCGEENERCHFM